MGRMQMIFPQLENRMVVDSEWPDAEQGIKEKLNGSGYKEISTGKFVPEEDAYSYALEMVSDGTEKDKKEFVEWFFSGNWIKED